MFVCAASLTAASQSSILHSALSAYDIRVSISFEDEYHGHGTRGKDSESATCIVDSEKCDGINVNSDVIFGHLDSSESALLLD